MPKPDRFLAEYARWKAVDSIYDRIGGNTSEHYDKNCQIDQDNAFDALSNQVDRMVKLPPTSIEGVLAFSEFLCDDFLHDEGYMDTDPLSVGVLTLANAMRLLLSNEDGGTLGRPETFPRAAT
jgi:hypothetical protein